jgi:nitroreductase/NAD-dependent dihydropyrimidine dehydrogenase PreA subunit
MITIDKTKCTGCGLCTTDCFSLSIKVGDSGKAEWNGDCIHCGHCVAICPEKAVSIPEFDMEDVTELTDLLTPSSLRAKRSNPEPNATISYNQLYATIKSRRTIRHFTDESVSEDALKKITEVARYTPTAKNLQENRITVVQSGLAEFKSLVWEQVFAEYESGSEMGVQLEPLVMQRKAFGTDPLFRDAPAAIFIANTRPWDAAMAAANIELAAVSQGLGVMYNGYLARTTDANPEIKKWLKADERPITCAMLIGHPAVTYKRTAPRKKAEVVNL